MPSPKGDERDRVLRGIAVTATAVWVLAVLVQLIDPTRQVPDSVNVVMGIAVSALVGTVAASTIKRNGGNGDA